MVQLALLYFAVFGGDGKDFPQGIAVDGSGYVAIAGTSGSTNFPVTEDAGQIKPAAKTWTPFAMKTSGEGAQRLYSTYLGGKAVSYGTAVAAGMDGSVCLAGAVSGDFPVTAGAAQAKYAGTGGRLGAGDAFVAKFDAAGKLVYASYFGGSSDEGATAVAMGEGGECMAAGFTTSGDLPVTKKSAYSKRPKGVLSGFLAVFSHDGKRVVYATYLPHDVLAMQATGGMCYVVGKNKATKIGCKGKREIWSVGIAREGEFGRALTLDGANHLRVVSESEKGGKGAILRLRSKDGVAEGTAPFGENEFTSIHGIAAAGGGRLWIGGSAGQPEKAFVALLDAEGKTLQRRNSGEPGEVRVRALAAGPQGTVFAAGETEGDVFVWKLQVSSARDRSASRTEPATLATARR
ncbi:MAG: SBBP repeat-containing protein [Bryobacterales bacterium]|nr:SBBP repeat-containing protein [Bryobacterales bacterium]